MLSKILSFITGAPVEAGVKYFQKRAELKQELKLKKLEGLIADQQAKNDQAGERAKETHTWEMAHLAQMGGWKDEFVLLVIYSPMIMAFIPFLARHALEGFKVMDKMPPWYQGLVVVISLAIYGIRAYSGKNQLGKLIGAAK